jgi:septal ring factor EnvC (AmiA/AmiB activator)
MSATASQENNNSWEQEETSIKQHLALLAEQQNNLKQEMTALTQEFQHCNQNVASLQSSLQIVETNQSDKKNLLSRQLQQALKWDLKNKAADQTGMSQSQRSIKSHLLTKILAEQKQQLKAQLALIKEFDAQISDYLIARDNIKEQIQQREDFLTQLLQNDEQLRKFLELCQQEQQKESVLTTAQGPSHDIIGIQPFDPDSLLVPLPLLSGRQQRDFFGASVISGKEGEPISSVGPGKVIFSDYMKGLGHVLMIEHEGGYLSLYGNCAQIYKKIGDEVAGAELIATVGSSGQLGVSALYFEFRHDAELIAPHWARESSYIDATPHKRQ